jgi:hypothetical protein
MALRGQIVCLRQHESADSENLLKQQDPRAATVGNDGGAVELLTFGCLDRLGPGRAGHARRLPAHQCAERQFRTAAPAAGGGQKVPLVGNNDRYRGGIA